MTDTTPRTEQEKGWEEERREELKKALAKRAELDKIRQAKEALKKKEAAAKAAIKKGERILDTNAKCALAGCILGALRSKAVEPGVVSALVGILDHGLKPRDRRLILDLYGSLLPGLSGGESETSRTNPTPEPAPAPTPAAVEEEKPEPETIECPGKTGEKCFNILTVKVAQKPEHAGKRYVRCDSCGYFKWLD